MLLKILKSSDEVAQIIQRRTQDRRVQRSQRQLKLKTLISVVLTDLAFKIHVQ